MLLIQSPLNFFWEKFLGTLITLLHADDVVLEEEEEQTILINTLIHQSDYLLSVRGLESGFSKDISGEVIDQIFFIMH